MKYLKIILFFIVLYSFVGCKKEVDIVEPIIPLKETSYVLGDYEYFIMKVNEQKDGSIKVIFEAKDSLEFYMKKGFVLKGDSQIILDFQNYKTENNTFVFSKLDDNSSITYEDFINLNAYIEVRNSQGNIYSSDDFGINYNSENIKFANDYCTANASNNGYNCNTGLLFFKKGDGYIVSSLFACAYTSELKQNNDLYVTELWSGDINNVNATKQFTINHKFVFELAGLYTFFKSDDVMTFEELKTNDFHIRIYDKDNNLLTKVNAGSN